MRLSAFPLWIQDNPAQAAGLLFLAIAVLTWVLKRS